MFGSAFIVFAIGLLLLFLSGMPVPGGDLAGVIGVVVLIAAGVIFVLATRRADRAV